MAFLAMTALVVLLLLVVEQIFSLLKQGRTVLRVIYFTWGMVNAILSVRQNQAREFEAFAISLLNSLVAFILWQWVSSWIRQLRACHNAGSVPKSPLDYMSSMSKNHMTETVIAALPRISNSATYEAQRIARPLDLNDAQLVECILDLELLGGFDKALEFTRAKDLPRI